MSEPSRLRKIVSALLVILFVIAIWALIEWRSAPPPPPAIKMPWE